MPSMLKKAGIIKKIAKKGKQNLLNSRIWLLFDFLWYIIWSKLIIIEIGKIRTRVVSKLFPNNKKIGVPNNSNPTPNRDWKTTKKNIIEISNNRSIIFIINYKIKRSNVISKINSK